MPPMPTSETASHPTPAPTPGSGTTPGSRTASAADSVVPGATVVAEAATAEAALADVHARLGPDARILDARRMLRGGIGGFFSREVVQLHAAPPESGKALSEGAGGRDDDPDGGTAEPARDPQASPTSGPSPIDRLLRGAEVAEDTLDFATFLRRQIAASGDPAAAADEPTPGAVDTLRDRGTDVEETGTSRMRWPSLDDDERPAWADARVGAQIQPGESIDVSAEPGVHGEACADRGAGADAAAPAVARVEEPRPANDGGPRWSVTTLMRLGLPTELVRCLDVTDPADDLAWTHALATALRPLCRPLPHGDALLVGPRAVGLGRSLGMSVASVGATLEFRGDVAANVGAAAVGRAWLTELLDVRWLHLVVGGRGWRNLLHADPLAVSWASPEDLPDAVRCAVELGLVLGYGPLGRGSGRARPLDVALAVRDLVPTR